MNSPYKIKERNVGKELYIQEFGQEAYEKRMQEVLPSEEAPRNWPWWKRTFEKMRLNFFISLWSNLFALGSLFSGFRMTHSLGVGAKGKLYIDPDFDLEELPLFRKQSKFDIHVRQADATYLDNASNVVRSCSIKLLDESGNSQLDLLMNSGPKGAFWNIPSFKNLIQIRKKGESSKNIKDYIQNDPVAAEGLGENIYRIENLTDLDYYTRIKYQLPNKKACQFRCVSTTRTAESAISNEIMDKKGLWTRRRFGNDKRPYNYLHQAYAEQLEKETIRYTLQVQLKDIEPHHHSFSRDLFYFNADWGTPWITVGEVVIDAVLSAEETRNLAFAITNRPDWLQLPESHSIHDYCSLAVVRDHLYKKVQPKRKKGYQNKKKKGEAVHYNFGTDTHPQEDGSNIKD